MNPIPESHPDPWDISERDPVQDMIDAFWIKNPKTMLEKYSNEFVKSMIPEKYWPKE
jgi:hypothetical protein